MTWIVVVFAVIALFFGIGAILGAPYLPIFKRDTKRILTLSGIKSGDQIIDLGSGDGRLLKAAAQLGANAIGYEINPLLYAISLIVTWPERRHVKIYLANYWQIKLPEANIIYVFLLDRYMNKLASKLAAEVQPDGILISYIFQIPDVKPLRQNNNSYVYSIRDLKP